MDMSFIDFAMDLGLSLALFGFCLYFILMFLFAPLERWLAERRYQKSPEGRAAAAQIEATKAWLASRAREDQANG
ncbi:hypothetical protein [uncultured Stenotrophomonas sp.]|uniref:hypothetical protein n=1 Tax=uncultured Stenotrophomonas sp. TaxID=165438 RepID=UPI0025DAAAA1|nr:hypothetical protein [uncultured Stenotrophomonas sp.]